MSSNTESNTSNSNKKHIIRNNRTSNSIFKKHKVTEIKNFFKDSTSVKGQKGDGIGIVFKEVFKLLETYQRIDSQLLRKKSETDISSFLKYHKKSRNPCSVKSPPKITNETSSLLLISWRTVFKLT